MSASEAIAALLAQRDDEKSICPSEAARLMDPTGWRGRMKEVRIAAAAMAERGQLVATQRGVPVDALRAKGPIRLRLP